MRMTSVICNVPVLSLCYGRYQRTVGYPSTSWASRYCTLNTHYRIVSYRNVKRLPFVASYNTLTPTWRKRVLTNHVRRPSIGIYKD